MSLTAAHLDALVDAGATAAQIVALVKADLAERERQLADKRAKDAERQRRHRESRDVTVTGCDPSPSEVSPHTPLPNSPNQYAPLSPPKLMEEKRVAIASCLRQAFPPPDGVGDEQWAAFCKQRRKKLNDRSYLLLSNKLGKLTAAGFKPADLIDRAIESGWETVYEPRASETRPPAKQYVSASGYVYRGSPEEIQREAKRRADNDTYWQVEVDRKREAQGIGNLTDDLVKRVGGRV